MELQTTKITIYLLEWPNPQTLISNPGKDVKQQELSFIDGGNTKWYNHFEGSSMISCKTKHIFTKQSSNPTLWSLPKGSKNLGHTKPCSRMFLAA